jgi:phosphate transport system substrate-binding protein
MDSGVFTGRRAKQQGKEYRMKKILTALCLGGIVAFAGLILGCGKSRTAVTMAGSTAFQPFAEKLADLYMNAHPDVAVTVQGGGSAVGIRSALSGAAQIGMADMVTLPAEASALTSFVVARDGIAIVVHPSNPVKGLTISQVHDIFNGKIRNWKDVGGEDKPIAVVSREAGSGTRSSFEQIVGDLKLTPDALIQDSNGTIRETVANDPNAIGYLSHGLLSPKINAVPVDGAACTEEAIQAGSYKLVRPIFLLTKGAPTPACQAVIDYMLSPEGQKVIRASGLIGAK